MRVGWCALLASACVGVTSAPTSTLDSGTPQPFTPPPPPPTDSGTPPPPSTSEPPPPTEPEPTEPTTPTVPPPMWFAGVNLAGAEFGEDELPGTFGVDYTYPTLDELLYFQASGMNIVRLPFRWERLQPKSFAELDLAEVDRLDAFVADATALGLTVVLDPHNYARYYGGLVGVDVASSALADFWSRLAPLYANDPYVWYGLMNEPHSMATETWLSAANESIAAIRDAGAGNLVLVPGNAWTGAHSWLDGWYGTPNGTVMSGVEDPDANFAYELHQYFDDDASGTTDTCVSATIGSERVAAVTDWLRAEGAVGWLGEFGAAPEPTCDAAVADLLAYLDANRDVWLGWAWWAAGPWWDDYSYSLEPVDGVDAEQMAVLAEYLP